MMMNVLVLLTWHPFLAAMSVLFVVVMLILGGCFRSHSWRHRRYRRQAARVLAGLPQLAGEAQRMAYLRTLNPYVFEELLLTAWARRGYRIVRNARYSGDGGMDGQVWLDGQRYLIQAKRYASTITPTHVAALNDLARQHGCRGVFVHTGRTGPKSRALLRDCPALTLLSGARLLALLDSEHPWSLHGHETSLHPASSRPASGTAQRVTCRAKQTVEGGVHE